MQLSVCGRCLRLHYQASKAGDGVASGSARWSGVLCFVKTQTFGVWLAKRVGRVTPLEVPRYLVHFEKHFGLSQALGFLSFFVGSRVREGLISQKRFIDGLDEVGLFTHCNYVRFPMTPFQRYFSEVVTQRKVS